MTNLKILVVYPLYGGSLPIAQYTVQALKNLGHTVDFFDAPEFNQAHNALRRLQVSGQRLNELENSFVNILSEAVYAKVESFMPDLVLALAQAPLTRQVLSRLRRQKITTAMWFVEDFQVFNYWRGFAEFYDFFFVIQKEAFLNLLAQIPNTHAYYLPTAALPQVHKAVNLSPEETQYFGSDLAFLGAGYPNRRIAFRQLTNYNFKIWGSDWEEEKILAKHIQNKGQRINVEDSVKIYSATKINLNLHSSIQSENLISGGDFINPRTFELGSIGAFQLVDQRQLMPLAFKDDELATFSSLNELKEKIDFYLNHPEERLAQAQKTQAAVHARHSYEHRMTELLNFIQNQKPNFGKTNSKQKILESLDPDLKPETKEEITQLLLKYNLPASADLEDLVAKIKLEQGILNPAETAILFLAEWKKQYNK